MSAAEISEVIWNLKRLIRDGYPRGLPVSILVPRYKTYFPSSPLPRPSLMAPGCKNWTQVIETCAEFKAWFRMSKKTRLIHVHETPEDDLKDYFAHNCYNRYKSSQVQVPGQDRPPLPKSPPLTQPPPPPPPATQNEFSALAYHHAQQRHQYQSLGLPYWPLPSHSQPQQMNLPMALAQVGRPFWTIGSANSFKPGLLHLPTEFLPQPAPPLPPPNNHPSQNPDPNPWLSPCAAASPWVPNPWEPQQLQSQAQPIRQFAPAVPPLPSSKIKIEVLDEVQTPAEQPQKKPSPQPNGYRYGLPKPCAATNPYPWVNSVNPNQKNPWVPPPPPGRQSATHSPNLNQSQAPPPPPPQTIDIDEPSELTPKIKIEVVDEVWVQAVPQPDPPHGNGHDSPSKESPKPPPPPQPFHPQIRKNCLKLSAGAVTLASHSDLTLIDNFSSSGLVSTLIDIHQRLVSQQFESPHAFLLEMRAVLTCLETVLVGPETKGSDQAQKLLMIFEQLPSLID